MKKKLYFLIFTILLFVPFYVKADGIDNYYIDAIIEETGNILIQEYFTLTGDFNGFERIIEYSNDQLYEFDPNTSSFGSSNIHNGNELEILEVRAISKKSNFDFTDIKGNIFKKTNNASKGDFGIYEEKNINNGKNILIYNPSSYNKAFYIKYRINNMAVRHNDVGELYWNLIGDELDEPIGNFRANIHIPNNTSVKAWAHGPLNGKINILDNENVLVTITNLSSYSSIDVRLVFDLNVINKSNKTTNVNALDKILLYEESKEEQANYERQNQEKQEQQHALELLNNFEVNLYRYQYDCALDYILDMTDSTIKEEYLNRLSELKLLLDKKEEQEAIDAINYIKKEPEYKYYKKAEEKIAILDDEAKKTYLYQELSLTETLIKKEEIKKEVINYIFGFILLFIIIYLEVVVYKKYRKDPITKFNQQYLREIPNNYSPEIVSYLFYKKITDKALSAAILDLIRKKIITVEKLSCENYKLTINSNYKEELNSSEKNLVKLLLYDRKSIETNKIKALAESNYSEFLKNWNSYHDNALNIAEKCSFYENIDKPKKKINILLIFFIFFWLLSFRIVFIVFIVLFIVFWIYKIIILILKNISLLIKNPSKSEKKILFLFGFIICFIISILKIIDIFSLQHFYMSSIIFYLIISILSLCFIPMIYNKKKRTLKGANEYRKWSALKNFLNDFGKFSDKEVMEVELWEKYLVFATLFNCANEITEVIKIEMIDNPDNYIEDYSELNHINRNITSSIKSSYNTAKNIRSTGFSSSYSSSRRSSSRGRSSSRSRGFSSRSRGGGGGGGGRRF